MSLRQTLARARRHARHGKAFGYPRCCRARFIWDAARGRYPALMRGGKTDARRGIWVPCGWLHQHDEDTPPQV